MLIRTTEKNNVSLGSRWFEFKLYIPTLRPFQNLTTVTCTCQALDKYLLNKWMNKRKNEYWLKLSGSLVSLVDNGDRMIGPLVYHWKVGMIN